MVPLTSAVPDKVDVLADVHAVLAWDLDGSELPSIDAAMALTERFRDYSWILVEDLRTQRLGVPADSEAGISAQAVIVEAVGRLAASLPNPLTAQSASRRAQNIARLLKSLLRATGLVGEELCRAAPRPSGDSPKDRGLLAVSRASAPVPARGSSEATPSTAAAR